MTTENGDCFLYSPLQDDPSYQVPKVQGTWAIRLIELQPGTDPDICCTLHHIPLGKANGHYEALSYVWGKAELTELISVNEKRLFITSNLASALRRLRYEKSARRLWIDAISIDQKNVEEKNVQVQRMWAIYALAHRVIIDLGEESWSSTVGMDMIERLAKVDKDPHKILEFFDHGSHQNFAVACKGLRNIFDRPWWSRVWVVQEVAVASRVAVMCGEGTLPWADFETVVDILTDLSFHPENYVNLDTADVRLLYLPSLHLASAWSICTARRRFRADEEHSLASMMISFRSAQTSDPRDHLYGLLKLSPEAQAVTPDYTKAVIDVYMDIVRMSITSDVGLAILSGLNYGHSRSGLPSWCPDWSAPSPANFPFYTPYFRCTKDKQVQSHFNKDILTLRGLRLDRVIDSNAPASSRLSMPLEEVFEAADKLRTEDMNIVEFTRQVADFIERATWMFTRERYFEYMNVLDDSQERKIAQIYGTWLMRRTLEVASNPASYTLGVQNLSDSSALAVINNRQSLQVVNVAHGRTIFLTEQGELGLAPSAAQAGDIIVALYGGRTPFCLRPIRGMSGEQYEILGDCYVEKWMYGDAISLLDEQKLHEEDFALK